jgi:hypothetical protein
MSSAAAGHPCYDLAPARHRLKTWLKPEVSASRNRQLNPTGRNPRRSISGRPIERPRRFCAIPPSVRYLLDMTHIEEDLLIAYFAQLLEDNSR